jgi:hypothetical protein
MINLTFYHFRELHKKGYTLDMVYLLELATKETDIKALCEETPKLGVLFQGVVRKGLITEDGAVSTVGKELLEFLQTEGEDVKLVRRKVDDDFDRWWKAYPGTDTFTYKGKSFTGSRSMRVKKDECKVKLKKILEEGEYTIDDLIAALEFEVLQKKENSLKTGTNKLTFQQNSLTYLNQRTFEPFIELVKAGETIKESHVVAGGTDI